MHYTGILSYYMVMGYSSLQDEFTNLALDLQQMIDILGSIVTWREKGSPLSHGYCGRRPLACEIRGVQWVVCAHCVG